MSSLLNNADIDKLIIMALGGMVIVLIIALIVLGVKKNTYYVDEDGEEIPVVKKKKKGIFIEEVEEEDDEPVVTPASVPLEVNTDPAAPAEATVLNILHEESVSSSVEQVEVTVVIGGHASEKTITSFPCSIGRESDNKLIVNEPAVSRKHARFVTDDGRLYIEDVSEHNGTYVNRTKLPSLGRARLHEGDIITLGRAELKIEHIQ